MRLTKFHCVNTVFCSDIFDMKSLGGGDWEYLDINIASDNVSTNLGSSILQDVRDIRVNDKS
jgi:hypothetical protein